MMTSSNGNIFCVTGSLRGELTGLRWIPVTKAIDAELRCFFDLRLNKRLSKQSWDWCFVTPSRSFWRHCNACFQFLSSISGSYGIIFHSLLSSMAGETYIKQVECNHYFLHTLDENYCRADDTVSYDTLIKRSTEKWHVFGVYSVFLKLCHVI